LKDFIPDLNAIQSANGGLNGKFIEMPGMGADSGPSCPSLVEKRELRRLQRAGDEAGELHPARSAARASGRVWHAAIRTRFDTRAALADIGIDLLV
jgi:hypothetical protein